MPPVVVVVHGICCLRFNLYTSLFFLVVASAAVASAGKVF